MDLLYQAQLEEKDKTIEALKQAAKVGNKGSKMPARVYLISRTPRNFLCTIFICARSRQRTKTSAATLRVATSLLLAAAAVVV